MKKVYKYLNSLEVNLGKDYYLYWNDNWKIVIYKGMNIDEICLGNRVTGEDLRIAFLFDETGKSIFVADQFRKRNETFDPFKFIVELYNFCDDENAKKLFCDLVIGYKREEIELVYWRDYKN